MLTLLLSALLTFVELNCENLFDTRHDWSTLPRATTTGPAPVTGAS